MSQKKIDHKTSNNKPTKIENNILINMSEKAKKTTSSKTTKKTAPAKSVKSIKVTKNKPVTVPKKRGRRPQKIITDDSEESNNSDTQTTENKPKNTSNGSLLVKLTINPDHLKRVVPPGKKQKTVGFFESESENTDSEDSGQIASDTIFKNDVPFDSKCDGCNCDKKDKIIAGLKAKLEKYNKKERAEKVTKLYTNKIDLINVSTNKKLTIKTTNIRCWWDGHAFDTIPFFLPDYYHNSTYYVRGCFCSPNCALAYNLYVMKDAQISMRKSLIYRLYRLMYGIDPTEKLELSTAGPYELLTEYGGELTIDEFREKNKIGDKDYIKFVPPISPIGIHIQERSTDQPKNESGYVLERSKPLSKTNSIMSEFVKD